MSAPRPGGCSQPRRTPLGSRIPALALEQCEPHCHTHVGGKARISQTVVPQATRLSAHIGGLHPLSRSRLAPHAPDVGTGGPPAPHGSSSGTKPGAGDLTGDTACSRGRCWRGFWGLLPPQDPPTHDLLSKPSPQLHHGTWGTLLRGCENHFLLGGRGNVMKGFLRDTHCSWRALGAPACTNLSPFGWQGGARADGVSVQTRAGLEEVEEQTQTPCRPSISASSR